MRSNCMKGSTQVAPMRLLPHQRDVGPLIRRIDRDQVLPTLGLA